MSITSKNKHVQREVLEDYPVPTENQSIVKVVCPRGNNLHEAMWTDGTKALCSMPTKYRNRVWIKRGDFMIVEPIEEGDKVAAEIVNILLDKQIRHIKSLDLWPPEFLQRDRREERVAEEAKAASVGGAGVAGDAGAGGVAAGAGAGGDVETGTTAASAAAAATTIDESDPEDPADVAAAAAAAAESAAIALAYGNDAPGAATADVLDSEGSESEDDMSDLGPPPNNRHYHDEEPDDEETESEDEAGEP